MDAGVRALRAGDYLPALDLARAALDLSPEHPEALRLAAAALGATGDQCGALDLLRRALPQAPDDARLLIDLGASQHACGLSDDACATWRRACEVAPGDALAWFNLGRGLQLAGRTLEAADALESACSLAPDAIPARVMLADALVHLARFDAADAQYREVLWRNPACGDAWRGLGNMKGRPLSIEDCEQLALNHDRADIAAHDRIAMGYVLGKTQEELGEYPTAFDTLKASNMQIAARTPWDRNGFHGYIDAVLEACVELPEPIDRTLGREAILIVGLPRSGSTLIEQILAAHPDVEGGSELIDLGAIMAEESVRRGSAFPRWVGDADANAWARLGREYMARTARWRLRSPRFTDKMPENWLYAGVLRAMLPGAIVIDVRRDGLETGWSCFKQHFYVQPHFSCDLADIGAYLRDCERAMDAWRARNPDRILLQRYETLLDNPDEQIRSLLDACGLAFDPRCREFHLAERSVRTASAHQVRQPLQRPAPRAAHYGTLLHPLREAIAGD